MKAGISLIGMLLFFNTAFATDYYVNSATGDNSTGDGTSTKPWKTITYALSKVGGTGHIIHVAAGTYNPALGETFPIVMKDGVSLTGAGAVTTIIDAGKTNRVLNCIGITDPATYIEGFTFAGGSLTTYGSQGGGIFISAGSLLRVRNNTISNNYLDGYGGGIYIVNSSPVIINNTISGNSTSSSGYGNAIAIYNSAPKILRNTIINNTSGYKGCTYIYGSSAPRIINNVIANNTNGICCTGGSPTILNNTISFNSGDGIFISYSQPDSIMNNIISSNTGFGIYEEGSSSDPDKVTYNLFYANDCGLYFDEQSTAYYTSVSLNTGMTECKNNIDGDPLFVDRGTYNFHEMAYSAAIDAGDPAFSCNKEPSPNGGRINAGAYGNTEEAVSYSEPPVLTADLYVNASTGNNSTGNGSSGNPWKTITYALGQVFRSGHTIHIAAGTYNTSLGETFPIEIKNGVSLAGAGASTTIINADETNRVFNCIGITDSHTIIEGLTITGGLVSSNFSKGGGLYISAGSVLTLRNNIIQNNNMETWGEGGAFYISRSSPVITSNDISNNSAGWASDGNAFAIYSSSPLIEKNTLLNNTGTGSLTSSCILISDHNYQSGSPKIIGNLIAKNYQNGIVCEHGSPTIINNTISDNSQHGIYINWGTPDSIFNNIISYNAGYGIYEYYSSYDPGKVWYNLFYSNSEGLYYDEGSTGYFTAATLNSSVAECKNNLSGDPVFVDKTNNKYRIFAGSPAINAGDPASPLDSDGSRADIGAYYYIPPPEAPVAIAAASITHLSFDANWNPSVNATGYYLDVATDADFTLFVTGYNNINAGNVTTFSVTGLIPVTVYYYRIRAYNDIGTGGSSNVINLNTSQVPAPGEPTALAATIIKQATFSANWNASPTATGYYLDVATDNAFTNFIEGFNNKTLANVTTGSVTGLSSNSTYYYRIRAFNAGGTSSSSSVITVTTLADPPPVPSASAATSIAQKSFIANWGSSAGANGYYLDVATNSSFTNFVTGYNNKNVSNVLSCNVTGLIPNTSYYYRVRAYNTGGAGASSNTITINTLQIQVSAHYVNASAGDNTTGDGTSAKPWKTITYALERMSGTGRHRIHVSAGTYNPALGESFPLMIPDSVSLVGAGKDLTIINANSTNYVIQCTGILDNLTRIEGFKISGGRSSGPGGIYITAGSALLITNNLITSNYADGNASGGAIHIINSSPRIEMNTITSNHGVDINKGATIYITGTTSAPVISNNTISDNANDLDGGGGTIGAGTIVVMSSSGTIIHNNIIINNNPGYFNEGGTVYMNSCSPSVRNNLIAKNIGNGICVFYSTSSPSIINNTISDNSYDGIYLYAGTPDSIFNNIISYNSSYAIREYSAGGDPAKVWYNLFYQNGSGLYYDEATTAITSVSTLNASVAECKNNLTGNPLFKDRTNNNYHLTTGSSAINAGDPASPLDPDGSRADIGAYPMIPPPDPPVATIATGITYSGFQANWNVSSTATGYYLDVATDEGFTVFASGFNNKDVANVIAFSVTGLNPNTGYHYRVRAYNADGTSASSNIINITTEQISAPAAPTASNATNIGQTDFTANWTSSATATGYYLDVATDNAFTTFVTGFSNKDVLNLTSYNITGLSANTSYYYRVRAYNTGGTSASSNTISLTTLLNPPAPPSAPVANSATKITLTTFTANWNAVSGATGYKLDVATDNSFTNYLTGYNNKAILNSTNDSVGGLTANTTYYYRVRASNSGGSSANSGTITVTTLANPPLPPVCTSASAITQTSFAANWNSSATASGYSLDVSPDNSFTTFVTGYNNKDLGNVTNTAVTGLSLNTAYYYRVRAYNSGGTSDNSNTISVTTLLNAPTQPSAPTATSATGIMQTSFTARWNTSSTSSGYYIDVSISSTFSTFLSGYSNKYVGNVTSTAVTGLSPKNTYFYRVRAYNTYGTSGNSNAITVTTLPNPPAAPSGLTVSSCNDQVTLTWSANTEADFLRYRIYGGTSANPTTLIDSTTTGSISAVSKTLSGLTHGKTFYLRITAVVSPGVASSYSSSVTVVVKKGVVPKIKSKFNDILICYNIGDSIASFQWYKGNTAISGATKQYYVTNKLPDSYSVLTTDKNGCKNSSNVINLTGSKSITVYPNPAKNSFMLEFSSENLGRVMITLYNSSGTKVAEYQTFKTDNEMKYEVPASDFLDGIYTLQVVVEETEISFSRVIIIN